MSEQVVNTAREKQVVRENKLLAGAIEELWKEVEALAVVLEPVLEAEVKGDGIPIGISTVGQGALTVPLAGTLAEKRIQIFRLVDKLRSLRERIEV